MDYKMKASILAILLMVSCVGLADTWTDPETGRTWSYRMIGDAAEITGGQYANWTGDLIIPEKVGDVLVTSIGMYAFYCCSNLVGGVRIPNGVTRIAQGAFGYCSKLSGALTLPEELTDIGAGAFFRCSSLIGRGSCKTPLPHHSRAKPRGLTKPAATSQHD